MTEPPEAQRVFAAGVLMGLAGMVEAWAPQLAGVLVGTYERAAKFLMGSHSEIDRRDATMAAGALYAQSRPDTPACEAVADWLRQLAAQANRERITATCPKCDAKLAADGSCCDSCDWTKPT